MLGESGSEGLAAERAQTSGHDAHRHLSGKRKMEDGGGLPFIINVEQFLSALL